MKAKRRHELQENVLSSELAQIVGFFRKRGSAIAWGVLIAALIVFVIVYARGRFRDKAIRLQEDFDTVMSNPTLTPQARKDLLKSLAEQDDEEWMAALSAVKLGDMYITEMTVAGPTVDPLKWKQLGDEAGRWYRMVTDSFGDEKLAVAKAHFGLGKLAENRGDFETARVEYQAALRMTELSGQDVIKRAGRSMGRLELLGTPVMMATTAPASQPTTAPASQLTTHPAAPTAPATTTPPTGESRSAPVTESSSPATHTPATRPKG